MAEMFDVVGFGTIAWRGAGACDEGPGGDLGAAWNGGDPDRRHGGGISAGTSRRPDHRRYGSRPHAGFANSDGVVANLVGARDDSPIFSNSSQRLLGGTSALGRFAARLPSDER